MTVIVADMQVELLLCQLNFLV